MVRVTFSPAFVIVSAKDIAQRAYEIYVDRGNGDGCDRQDWLRASMNSKTRRSPRESFREMRRDDDDDTRERQSPQLLSSAAFE